MIVNTLNRARSLDNTLLGLRQLRYPDFEVIVVHGLCTDDTLATLDRHRHWIRVAACPENNLSVSRNLGLSLATKTLVAFIDDDAVPEPDWLDRLAAGFSGAETAAVGGFIRDNFGVSFQHQVIVANRLGDARHSAPPAPALDHGDFLSPTGTNICLRRDCLVEIGGFDPAIAYFLDETDVNLRLIERGWSIDFAPDAEVHHYFLENEVRNRRRIPRSLYQIARSKAYFCWKHARPQHSAAAIEARLAAFRAQLRRQTFWFWLTGRLSWRDATRLRLEVDQGLQDGASSAEEPPCRERPARAVEGDVGPASPQSDARPRVCWIARGDEPNAEVRELARLGHEVTVLGPSGAVGTAVSFDGVWRHRLGLGPAPRVRHAARYGRASLREIERIWPRRRFDVVLCPGELQSFLAPLSAKGVRVVARSDEDPVAKELDATIRSMIAASPP